QRRLAATLDEISRAGAKAVYGGDVGAALASDVQAKGGSLALSDLASYRAQMAEPLDTSYHAGRIFAAPGMTGGPGLAAALRALVRTAKPGHVDYARALDAAWRERLAGAGDQ